MSFIDEDDRILAPAQLYPKGTPGRVRQSLSGTKTAAPVFW